MSNRTDLENNNEKLQNISSILSNIQNVANNLPQGGGSGDIKLFETISEMQSSSGNQDGDLAVVYRNSIGNLTEDTEFQVGTFPEIVTLPTAVTDYIDVSFVPVESTEEMFDCWGNIDSSRFNMSVYTDDGNIRIEYTSSDGINYTRSSFMKNEEDISGNEMDFEVIIKFSNRYGEAPWDDRIGYFIQVGTVVFDGLFQYEDNTFNYAKTQFSGNPDYIYKSTLYGKNGILIGSLQNVENLSISQVLTKTEIYDTLSELSLNTDITDLSNAFDGKRYKYIPNFNTSNVTNMSGMFRSCYNLVSVPNFDTSNVTNMHSMFYECSNLVNIPNFDTSNVTDMSYIFMYCHHLTSIPNFNTSNVTNMHQMFYNSGLTIAPNFDMSNVMYADGMFADCRSLTSIPNFNLPNTKSTNTMFRTCVNLATDLNMNISNTMYASAMFMDCRSLTSISAFDTTNVVWMDNMFRSCYNLISVPILNMNNARYINGMFTNCNNLSADSYANIANSLPLAINLSNQYISNIGLNVENFTLEQKKILGDKGYLDTVEYSINTQNVSRYWNIQYT